MKFLIFNVIVGIALIYLFGGENGSLQAVSDKAYSAVHTIKSNLSATLKAPARADENPQAHIVLAKPTEAPSPELKLPQTEPVKLDPQISQRRKQILDTSTLPEVAIDNNGPMSSKERRQALMQLAEDMEYFSAKAMSY